jgi:hypothetical protein
MAVFVAPHFIAARCDRHDGRGNVALFCARLDRCDFLSSEGLASTEPLFLAVGPLEAAYAGPRRKGAGL